MAWQIISVLMGTFAALLISQKLAPQIGLVDAPDARKRHQGQVPLVGGLAIGIVFCAALMQSSTPIAHQSLFLLSVVTLVALGVIDDKFDLSCRSRLLVQTVIATVVAVFADIQLVTFGNVFGFGYVTFQWLSIPLTVIAVIGAINAFNMVDGLDGLLGTLASITLLGLCVLFALQGDTEHIQLCVMLLCCLLPYLTFNLSLWGSHRRIFMGDAGSMMIGFVVVWLLFTLTQPTPDLGPHQSYSVRPVTALWLIAIPLMDMVAIMVRRAKKGQSPMAPDRGHLHHIFQRIGFNARQTLFIISAIALCCAAIGIIGEVLAIKESTMFYLFLTLFSGYYWTLHKIFRLTAYLRLIRRTQPPQASTG